MRHLTKYVWKWIAIAAVTTAFVIVTPPQPTAEAGIVPEALKPWSSKGTLTSFHLRARVYPGGDKELFGKYPPKTLFQKAHRYTCYTLMHMGAVGLTTAYFMGAVHLSWGGAAETIFTETPAQFGTVNGDGTIGVQEANCIDKGSCSLQAGHEDFTQMVNLLRGAIDNGELGVSQPFQVMPLILAHGYALSDPNRSSAGDVIRSINIPYLQSFIPDDPNSSMIAIPYSKEEIGHQIDQVLNQVGFQNMLMHSLIDDLMEAYYPARESYFLKDSELSSARTTLDSLRTSGARASEIRQQQATVDQLEAELATLAEQLNAAEESIRQEISKQLGVEVDQRAVHNMITSPVGSSLLRHLIAVANFKGYVEALRVKIQEQQVAVQQAAEGLDRDSAELQLRSYIGTYALTTRIMAVAIQDYIKINNDVSDYFDSLISKAESLIDQDTQENTQLMESLSEAVRARVAGIISNMEQQRQIIRNNPGNSQTITTAESRIQSLEVELARALAPLTEEARSTIQSNIRNSAIQFDVIRMSQDYQRLLAERNDNLQVRYNEMLGLFSTIARDLARATTVAQLAQVIESMETTAEAVSNVLSDNPQNFFSLSYYTEGLRNGGNYLEEAVAEVERGIRTDITFGRVNE